MVRKWGAGLGASPKMERSIQGEADDGFLSAGELEVRNSQCPNRSWDGKGDIGILQTASPYYTQLGACCSP